MTTNTLLKKIYNKKMANDFNVAENNYASFRDKPENMGRVSSKAPAGKSGVNGLVKLGVKE